MEYKYDKVFIFRPWEKIFKNSNVRTETFQQSIDLDRSIINAYINFGYHPIEVVKGNIEERVNFILDNL